MWHSESIGFLRVVKLRFDENRSFRLVRALADVYPDSQHVLDAGLLSVDDAVIWEYAAERGFLLVFKDRDFYERSLLFGAPPRVIRLRVGNTTIRQTSDWPRHGYILIRRFDEHPAATFLLLDPS